MFDHHECYNEDDDICQDDLQDAKDNSDRYILQIRLSGQIDWIAEHADRLVAIRDELEALP